MEKTTKTPDEIKKGLECCANDKCEECPYDASKCVCFEKEALEYIQQLEAKAGLVDQYRWERDVAIDQLEQLGIGFGEKVNGKLPRWISVKDHMPIGEDPVLILVKETEHYGLYKEKRKVYYCQYLAYWDGEEWFTTWCNGCRKITDTAKEPYADDYEVTHWTRLPEPPTEE